MEKRSNEQPVQMLKDASPPDLAALALSAEVDRTYVSQIERAIGNPSLLVPAKIADALDVSIPELLSDIPATHHA